MVIWLALLIPLIGAVVLHFRFGHKVVWWELVLPFGVCLLLVSLSKVLITYGQTTDTEYLTTWCESAEYWEDWSELVVKTRTVSDGKNTRTETYVENEYHPPEWYVVDATGRKHGIHHSTFDRLCAQFGNRHFASVPRFGAITKSGGVYTTKWPKSDQSMEVLCLSRSYENRVQAAPSVFGHRRIDKKERVQYGLFDYPDVRSLSQRMILGWDDAAAERQLSITNAKLGAQYQIRIWVLVFKDRPIDAAYSQESYWNGGNKNELVLCVGVDGSGIVQWGTVFSWTERETFKAEVRTLIEHQIGHPLDASKLVTGTAELVPTGWQRKHFKEFNYLSVEPPTWAVVLVYFLTTAVTVGLCWWAVVNDVKPLVSSPPTKRLYKE